MAKSVRSPVSVSTAFGRFVSALVLAAPGGVLGWFYMRRLIGIRADPSGAPGTPIETWIALAVAAVAYVSFRLALAALRGRVHKPAGAAGFMSLTMVSLVVGLAFMRL